MEVPQEMKTRKDLSKIGWTDFSGGDANFVLRGKSANDCAGSPGCDNCYAAAIRQRGKPEKTSDYTTWSEPKQRALSATEFVGPFKRPGDRPMVFVCDMGDMFHSFVPDTFIERAFEHFADRPDVDWQILTKRPERMARLLAEGVPDNCWLGVTAENQAMANLRIPILASIKAAVRFVSVEPCLEAVQFSMDGISWVICGGESGPNRRPFRKPWAFSLQQQCQFAGVPYFFKQGSSLRPGGDDLLMGEQFKEWPK